MSIDEAIHTIQRIIFQRGEITDIELEEILDEVYETAFRCGAWHERMNHVSFRD